jgi:hypothetical protein
MAACHHTCAQPSLVLDTYHKLSARPAGGGGGRQFLTQMATPLDVNDRESLIKSASTSLSSKVVSQHSSLLAPMAVDCVLRVSEDCPVTSELLTTKAGSSLSGKRYESERARLRCQPPQLSCYNCQGFTLTRREEASLVALGGC